MADRPRVIIALPDIIESGSIADWLAGDGFEPVRRSSPKAAGDEMQARTFELLIADAGFAFRDCLLAAGRRRNPLTPTVVIGDADAGSNAAANSRIMFLPRPVERAMLVCTVAMAILDGRPTRRSTRKLVNRFQAISNGVPSHIIDMSNEGVRLELPLDSRSVPPPFFSVRVPLIGVAVNVQRVWALARPADGATAVTWCGGALAQNGARAEQGWRTFVDTIALAGQSSSRPVQIQ
jgi:hypothetical protein